MSSDLQKNLAMPFLWEIATFACGKVELYTKDFAFVTERLADLYHKTDDERRGRYRKSRKRIFESEVRYATNILAADGALLKNERVSYTITAIGLGRLRNFVGRELRRLSTTQLRDFFESRDENGQDFFLNALACHSPEAVSELARTASCYADLFIRLVEQLPLDRLGGFLTSAHHKREILLADHLQGYRHSANEPHQGVGLRTIFS